MTIIVSINAVIEYIDRVLLILNVWLFINYIKFGFHLKIKNFTTGTETKNITAIASIFDYNYHSIHLPIGIIYCTPRSEAILLQNVNIIICSSK